MSLPDGVAVPSGLAATSESQSPRSQGEDLGQPQTAGCPPRLRSFRDHPITNVSSTSLAALNAARRPGLPQASLSNIVKAGALPEDMQAKMKAFHLSRQGAPLSNSQSLFTAPSAQPVSSPIQKSGSAAAPPSRGTCAPSGMTTDGALMEANITLRPSPGNRPAAANFISAPAVPNVSKHSMIGLAAKRGLGNTLKLSDASKAPAASHCMETCAREPATLDESSPTSLQTQSSSISKPESVFDRYSDFVDTQTGSLKFKGKATIHGKGIDFSGGTSFSISLDEVDNLEELGKGNYGTVYRVRHNRPQMRIPGLGLNAIKQTQLHELPSTTVDESVSGTMTGTSRNSTGVVMAMKEIRLELDEAKFAAIIMELDILHRCVSPFIIDFYGAFFQEGAVYICMEYMNGGSIDKLYGDGIPEGVLRKITLSTVMGLKTLKDDHNIIHRDVKPTNILVNTRGQVKICDFGVSGNLVASIAKTNIGCQSYMAPERIASGGVAPAGVSSAAGTYSVQSDIWSLGLSIIECAMGQYPYPPETYHNIFSQLSVSHPIICVRHD